MPTKKVIAKKVVTKLPIAKKPVAKKTATKKVVTKSPITKKPVAKKTVTKKVVAKLPIAKKPIAKKTATKKVVAKSPIAKKPIAIKTATKKVVAKLPIAKKPAAKKVELKKPIAKKVVAKKSTPKKVELKKPDTKKVVAKSLPSKQVVKSIIQSAENKTKKLQEKVTKVLTKQATPAPKKTASKSSGRNVGIEKSTTVIPMKQLPMRKKEEPVKEVKVPKTSVKTSIPYNPVYTPLEKRVEAAKPNTPMVKYSDIELNEFRDIINKKLEAAKNELVFLQSIITRKDEAGGDNEDGRYMTMEDGSLSMEREQLSQRASRQISFIDNLEKALMRIENKTYGVCRITGKLIDKARLRAVPHATLSLEAKLGLVKAPNVE